MDEGARFRRVAAKAGHYESFYIKACEPGGGTGDLDPPHGPQAPGCRADGLDLVRPLRPRGGRAAGDQGHGSGRPSSPSPPVPGSASATPRSGPAAPRARSTPTALTAAWCAQLRRRRRPCKYLPADWLYEAPLPRTKFVAPFPNARFEGRLEIDDEEEIELTGWPGMIGHNWGSEHAERWVWLEGTGFEGSPGTYFDAGAARVKLGSRTSPWIPSGMLMLDGEPHRLGGLGAIRSARIEEAPTVCTFVLPGKDIVVRGRVSAPEKDFVGWVYADPKGPEHHTVNCSVADLELTVERPGLPARELTLAGGGAYELGMRETDHGIPIQPYPDG